MLEKSEEKKRAIKYRKAGLSYSEILTRVPVAKSTLSLWLKEVGLSRSQKQRLTEKKRLAQLKGALARKTERIRFQKEIYNVCMAQVGKISKRELWLIGTALYWAEGSKEKEYKPGSPAQFSNSDPVMIQLFIKWLEFCCDVSTDSLSFEVYIHKMYERNITRVKTFWSRSTNIPVERFNKCYFKHHNIKTKRKNSGDLYNGVLRVKVGSSSTLNRKIKGWTMGITDFNNWEIV